MNDLAARLAQRARPLAEAPAMVPYLPDRPADPRIAPESPLADFGGFGDAEAIGGEALESAVEGSLDAPWPVGEEPSRGLQPGRQDPERAPSILPAPAGELGRRIDHAVDLGEQSRDVPYQESHIAERLIERVHTSTVHIHGAPRPEASARASILARPEAPAETQDEALHARASERPDEARRLPLEPRDRPLTRSVDPAGSPTLPRTSSGDLDLPPAEEARPRAPATLAPAVEPPALAPAPAPLRPRERSLALDAPLVEPDPPTIHIGSITVEVVQSTPRADARRVQAPPDRPQRAAAAKPSARSSRPLRTFGLRQL